MNPEILDWRWWKSSWQRV